VHPDCPRTATPPDCLDDDLVAGYVDGALPAADQARVERLIDQCATCRRQVSELMRLRSTADASGTPTGGGPAPERIGRYQVRGVLGQGGMGVVVRAWDPELEREVAIKLVRGASADGALRLAREARAMAKVRHPAVLAVHDVGVAAGEVFVVMELIDGETLADWFARRPPWREALDRCRAAGVGLAAAHAAGLVHRDFKPHNVLCARDGRVLVADFGLARGAPGAETPSALTAAGAIVGTPAYMAPEQHLGEAVGPAADQFALAATIYEGLYGARLFAGTTLAALLSELMAGKVRPPPATSDVPPAVRAAVERGLAREPADRWPSVQALLDALDAPDVPARRLPLIPIAAAAVIAIAAVAGWAALRGGGGATSGAVPAIAHDAGPAPAAATDAAAPAKLATVPGMPDTVMGPPGRLFPADRLPHWSVLGDRPLIDARARAWAPDARILSITSVGVGADGIVDLTAGGYVDYSYVSPDKGTSTDRREIGRCTYDAYAKAGQEYAGPGTNTSCGHIDPAGPPRCTFRDIWRRARADGADPSLPAKIDYLRIVGSPKTEWMFANLPSGHFAGRYPDDCALDPTH
jgi:anti-sigma factor RsiW